MIFVTLFNGSILKMVFSVYDRKLSQQAHSLHITVPNDIRYCDDLCYTYRRIFSNLVLRTRFL